MNRLQNLDIFLKYSQWDIPKIFAVGSFQNEQPEKIVCRLMNEPFYEHKENGIPRMLDKRGIFIIVSLNNVYLWIGSKISVTNKDLYLKTAVDYINILKERFVFKNCCGLY